MTPKEQLIQAKAKEFQEIVSFDADRDSENITFNFLTAFAAQIEMTTREQLAKEVEHQVRTSIKNFMDNCSRTRVNKVWKSDATNLLHQTKERLLSSLIRSKITKI